MKIPEDIVQEIAEAAGEYAEERLKVVAPDLPEGVAPKARETVARLLSGRSSELYPLPAASILMGSHSVEVKRFTAVLIDNLMPKVGSSYHAYNKLFGEHMVETSFAISNIHGSPFEASYTWLLETVEVVSSNLRDLIIENLIEGPPKSDPALDILTDMAVIEVLLTSEDYYKLSDISSLNMSFSKIHIPKSPCSLNSIEILHAAIEGAQLNFIISKFANILLGFWIISPILVNRGVSKKWVEGLFDPEVILEVSGDPEVSLCILEGNGKDIAKEVVKRTFENLKESLEPVSDDFESFLTDVAKRVAGVVLEDVRLVQMIINDNR
ncbi:hypothetical protein [Methanopyrus sp.]